MERVLSAVQISFQRVLGRFNDVVDTPGTKGTYKELRQSNGDVELYEIDHEDAGTGIHATESNSSKDHQHLADGGTPDEHDKKTLRKVPDKLPWSAFLVAIVELCERSAFYGLSGPFQNYISNEYKDPNGLPGALGMRQSGATALTNLFQLWCYFTPILGAIIADQYLGKYKTIVYFSIIYMLGLVVLFLTSLPITIEGGAAFGGLICSMVLIGLGTGGIKANVSPLIAEQYDKTQGFIRVLKSGERVIVDPATTIQRLYLLFYMSINIGSLSPIATTSLEKYVGFWSAYLVPLVLFIIGFGILISGRKNYIFRPPQGSVIPHCFRVIWIGLRNRGNLNVAKPSYQAAHGNRYNTPWDDAFIIELQRAITGCKVFLFFPFYWLVYIQVTNNFVSQAGTMHLHNLPNDILQNIDPLTIIIFIPVFDRLLYPLLRRLHIPFAPRARIAAGFLLAACGMFYAAFVQSLIYSRAPCYSFPLTCPAAVQPDGKRLPNEISVAWQVPSYILIAISEILAAVSGLEYAYKVAPGSMKSLVMSLYLVTSAVAAGMGAGLSPIARDPWLVGLYAGLGVGCGIAGGVFWWIFVRGGGTDEEEEEEEEQEDREGNERNMEREDGEIEERERLRGDDGQ